MGRYPLLDLLLLGGGKLDAGTHIQSIKCFDLNA
jgi:hypothetical protein